MALSISPDLDHELRLRRPVDSCFINNNYFIAGFKGFRVIVDLRPVFNHYKCITHTSQKMKLNVHKPLLMQQKEAKKENMNVIDGLKKLVLHSSQLGK